MSEPAAVPPPAAPESLIHRLVAASLRQRFLVGLLAVLIGGVGVWSFSRLPVDAYPDLSPPMVEIVTQWPGHAAEEVERLITVPIEVEMNGIPHLSVVRSISLYGLSDVRLKFEPGTDDYFARQQVLERLARGLRTSLRNARNAREKLANRRFEAYIRAILIGFAGRTKQERVGQKPALFICETPAGPNCRENNRVTDLLRRIEDIVAPTVVGMGYELVDAQASSKGRLIRVFIDKPDGVDVEDCARVSEQLTRLFAVENIASGELIFNNFSSLAQFERRLFQERTKAGLAAVQCDCGNRRV